MQAVLLEDNEQRLLGAGLAPITALEAGSLSRVSGCPGFELGCAPQHFPGGRGGSLDAPPGPEDPGSLICEQGTTLCPRTPLRV